MTDELRDRVADVLFANFMRQAVSRGVADCMADALISAFKLRVVSVGKFNTVVMGSYATDWRTDESP